MPIKWSINIGDDDSDATRGSVRLIVDNAGDVIIECETDDKLWDPIAYLSREGTLCLCPSDERNIGLQRDSDGYIEIEHAPN